MTGTIHPELPDTAFTADERRHLERLERIPWKWFCSDERYFALVDKYAAAAQKRYFATVSRATTYNGPDYRMQFAGQETWVRATPWQYKQADHLGIRRSVGVPS